MIQIASLFHFAQRVGLERPFLQVWRKNISHKIINGPRHLLYRAWRSVNATNLEREEEVRNVINNLNRFGYAKTHVDKLRDMPTVNDLQDEYNKLLEREEASPHSRKGKQFIRRLVDDDYDFKRNKNSAISRFVTNRMLSAIAANYFELIPRRTSLKVWQSHFTGATERTASQNWHRDYNDKIMLRVFLYFDEVTELNGAGEYVAGSHFKGDAFETLQYREETGTYSTESEIRSNFASDRIKIANGDAGTIVFMDTGGLHRGGFHPQPGDRKVALLTFSTAADLQPSRMNN